MYFVTFVKDSKECVGVLTADHKRVVCLPCAEKEFFSSASIPATMRDIIEAGDHALQQIRRVLEKAEATPASGSIIALDGLEIRAPYKNPPRNIVCIGLNYHAHALEFEQTDDPAKAVPKFPIVFTKPWTTIADPNVAVDGHFGVTDCYDYETELAVIIGTPGRNITKAQAYDHVFGYSIINDLSARELQKRTSQWYSGKCLDESAPFGPYLVHKSAVPDPQNLNLLCTINGEVRQDSNTKLMIFDIPTIIETISRDCLLHAGDIIATGTCPGVGLGFNPPKYLKKGDVMELKIEKLGILRNTIR